MAAFQATVLGHDDPQEILPHASNLILIDNYDSFTYNVAQYLFLEGANVEVVRNDALTLEELIALKPTQLVISPGPGHPSTDSGISNEAIKHFAGKIPVLGVCMGQQCIYTAYGGTVASANEILHGKTSEILHDSLGLYAGIDQSISVTRYHSLAGTSDTLPSCLEVTSWTDDKGVIMGVRHKEYVLEGVQYHPESILTLTGRFLFRNFLKWTGGKWTDLDPKLVGDIGSSTSYNDWKHSYVRGTGSIQPVLPSKLNEIFVHRKKLVDAQKLVPSQRPSDLESLHNLMIAPPSINFVTRLKSSPFSLALMAEIKRASPSKGIIDINADAAVQARRYALAGAATISVLTEPEWFKGSIDDLKAARAAVEGLTNRPAILRKEFIFDEYQILEARLAGADTVLLIVKMLSEKLLSNLYSYSQSLGMEPLVEVNSAEEMKLALKLGAKVIGVNNRDLNSFKVDLGTTSSLVAMVPRGTILCALSGISERKDVEKYKSDGVSAVLVGESLMRAGKDAYSFVELLMGKRNVNALALGPASELLVKICGTRTPEAAKAAAEAGADLVGIIMVPKSKRCVSIETAAAISKTLRSTYKGLSTEEERNTPQADDFTQDFFKHHLAISLRHSTRSLLVGVFQNQPLSYILHVQKLLDLDVIQLHGQEPIEWAHLIPVPVLRAFKPDEAGLATRGYHSAPLLDAGSGGTGTRLERAPVQKVLDTGVSFILAGGLTPDNVREVIQGYAGVHGGLGGVDVSSGVETNGAQDVGKIVRFIKEAKGQ